MLVNLQSNTDPLYKGLDAVGAVDPPPKQFSFRCHKPVGEVTVTLSILEMTHLLRHFQLFDNLGYKVSKMSPNLNLFIMGMNAVVIWGFELFL